MHDTDYITGGTQTMHRDMPQEGGAPRRCRDAFIRALFSDRNWRRDHRSSSLHTCCHFVSAHIPMCRTSCMVCGNSTLLPNSIQWSLAIANLDVTHPRYNETSLDVPNSFVCVSPSWDPRCNELAFSENLGIAWLLNN